jgi:hypothetical protein
MLTRKEAPPAGSREQAERRQAAAYVCDMLLELRQLAGAAGLRHLTYLLELAIYEAFAIANGREPQPRDFRPARRQPGG